MPDNKKYPNSELPIRKSSELLPQTFRTENNDKFLSGVVDPLIQPGALDKLSGYIGRRFGRTYTSNNVYLDTDLTLRSRYQLEPGVTVENNQVVTKFYDYLDFKNIEKFFGNDNDRDDETTFQEHYSWNPPIDWDKFINYREYYWIPSGPPTVAVFGQTQAVQSTYKVNQGTQSTWVFTPDGLTNNPIITLYRGQTYEFTVNSPGEPFTLRTNYDTGSLNFNPQRSYLAGELAVFDGKLWRALRDVSALDGSSIDVNSQDWRLIDSTASLQSLNYNNGVTNNGTELGTVKFVVPQDAPDVIYYQSATDANRLGRFIIADIDSNTFLNVENEIIGKTYYRSANGVEFTNGMTVEFRGQVESEKYARDTWLVEGVGKAISLIRFADLIPPSISSDTPEVLFDNEGFDTQPFDDASLYPSNKDYVTINRSSRDSNPWSRYNRWFHRSVLEYAYQSRNADFDAPETARAKRPIIEFHPNIKLYQQGTTAKQTVDYVDDYTKDVFSTIEGSTGYSVDGESLFQGARVLVTADTDGLANNRIYEVRFIVHNGVRQITLQQTADSAPQLNQCVLASRGKNNLGKMFYYDGTAWRRSQDKINVNQAPLFDAFDENGVALDDAATYPVSSFAGSKIFSYREGTGPIDSELRFAISYLNINNVGDIQFDWNWETEQFTYTANQQLFIINAKQNYYLVSDTYENGWTKTNAKYLQPIVDSVTIKTASTLDEDFLLDITKTFIITTVPNPIGAGAIYQVDGQNKPILNLVRGGVYTFNQSDASNANHPIAFKDATGASYTVGVTSTGVPGQSGAQTVITVAADAPASLRYYCVTHGNNMGNIIAVTTTIAANTVEFDTVDFSTVNDTTEIIFYLNGNEFKQAYTRKNNSFTFATEFGEGDVLTIKIVGDVEPERGYYEIPVGLEKNPLNENLSTFTLGQATDHVRTALEFDARFNGTMPGVSNLRDISDFTANAKRFLKHSGVAASALLMLCDKEINIIKSLQYAKKQYSIFKENFIKKSYEVDANDSIPDLVDSIFEELNRTKNNDSPFADSDMIGTGAFTKIEYTVEDTGIKTFSLSERFDLKTLSRRAVYVYKNGIQLLNGRDYTFSSEFGFITLVIDLIEGEKIEIREYVSTASCHIPPTPTSIGLYKKYTPQVFIDDTYREPKQVIQGHDGSITIAYGDFRDDVLLELEYRIYNNIKQEYDPAVFDIDADLGGYYGNAVFNKPEFDAIANQEFLKWVANTNLGYSSNEYFKDTETFTYTYSNMTDPTGRQNLPGWWRGVYQWFYDTDRPHRCPWECLGFSEKPTWWEDEYGAAPYTSGNLLLWEDIRDGIIRQGDRAGMHKRYARTTIVNHIPVDELGNLLSPLDSGLAGNFTLINNKGNFKLGDVSPTEYAYRSSSEFPFVIAIALCLLRPFEFIIANFDRSRTKRNIANQIISRSTGVFITPAEIELPITGGTITAGLSYYVTSYLKYNGKSIADAQAMLSGINVRLSSRLSGFVDKSQQKYLLDSKSPAAASSSIFIPQENYDIIFNVSAPIQSVSYSGVIFEKTEGGWVVNGYDDVNPYFRIFQAIPNQKDPTISVGGLSATFTNWAENQTYNNGAIVEHRNMYYRARLTHTGTDKFDDANWTKLPNLPVIGAATAQRRRNFNRFNAVQISYGTKFNSVQAVVDFLLGYEEHLKSQGFVFENYSVDNRVVQDFTTAAKEFMFWTRNEWSIGSLLTVSPGAERLKVIVPVGVVDNLLDSFYDYNILTDTGEPIEVNNFDVKREFQTFTFSINNTTKGLYYIKLNYVLKEHVVIFSDRTVFNDVLFDKPTGYRQERIKVQGFRTVDWDGDYTSPGFLFDNVSIAAWQPFNDYKLGDIINFQGVNYTSKRNNTSGETFAANNWTVLDSTPEKRLIPNYDFRINQMEDYFDVDSEGLSQSQRDLARHTIGYQTRTYLQNLAEDEVTQFRLYQGFIREKGTNNSFTKLFNKLGRTNGSGVTLREEWAFKVGSLGGTEQSRVVEIKLDTENFVLNPQPVIVTDVANNQNVDRYYRINQSDFYFAPIPYSTNINPVSTDNQYFRTAGYVKVDQTKYIVKNRDDILNIDIDGVGNNDHIWITFDRQTWTVLRINTVPELPITNINVDGTTVNITFGKRHNLSVDDIIGLKSFGQISGFHKINAVSNFGVSFKLATAPVDFDDNYEPSSIYYPILLTNARFASYDVTDPEQIALLDRKAKLFIDDNGSGKWEVVEKNKEYDAKKIINFGTTDPRQAGKKVIYSNTHNQIIASIPGSGLVVVYIETKTGLDVKQLLEPLAEFSNAVANTFGEELCTSADGEWLIVGSPRASGVRSNYQGIFSTFKTYAPNDIVLYEGNLWKANTNITGDGSSINVYSQDWEQINTIEALQFGVNGGYGSQGMISFYRWNAQQWNYETSFVSPRPDRDRLFGSKMSIARTPTGYALAVSAPGDDDIKGRVYIYTYSTADGWRLSRNSNYRGIYQPGGTLAVTDILAGRTYTIDSPGTTNFTGIGSLNNLSGTTFVATEIGTGTGTVTQNSFYPRGSIVYHNGHLWQALEDNQGDGSTISIASNDWIKLDEVSTNGSLPTSVSIEDDGSTLASGILSEDQLAELIKEGDRFGSSVAFNSDASILVISAVNADGQYFPNYRGHWKANYEYAENDVVSYEGMYHRLENVGSTSVGPDSTIRSFNQAPKLGFPWVNVGDSTTQPVGKVFVYNKNAANFYSLKQTITAGSLEEISDLEVSETISSGDMFGYGLDLDFNGRTLVVTSPKADKNLQNQGSAYIFKYETDSTEMRYRLKQKIESYGIYPNEYFGQSVSMTDNSSKIVIGANSSGYNYPIRFDANQTSFDTSSTKFSTYGGYSGAVYVFDLKGSKYLLSEKLEDDLSLNESFGFSVYCSGDVILVGSPNYIEPTPHGPTLDFTGAASGMVRLFKKQSGIDSLRIIGSEPDRIDLNKIKRIALYNEKGDSKIQDLEVVDPAKLKILASAEREIEYKTLYDPATYNVGTEDVVVDDTVAWFGKNVGKLWWNVSTAKWIDYEQADTAYRLANWGAQALGSSVDVLEWVESKLLPSEWAVLADTTEGLQLGVSGQPLYADDTVYSLKEFLNVNTGLVTETKYYYWVKNKVTVPENTVGRTISAAEVAALINNPTTLGNTYLALAAPDKLFFYNYNSIVSESTSILNLEFYKSAKNNNASHNEFLLLTENDENSVPNAKLEKKWIDSLVGYDTQGNRVPDPNIPEKQKYGVGFRPRQSMFVNRKQILQQSIEYINGILLSEAFSNTINFVNLNLVDAQPDASLKLFDVEVQSNIDLQNVGTTRVRQAVLSTNIIGNEITSIDIVNPGFGYRPQGDATQSGGTFEGPPVTIQGNGENAEAVTRIDSQGRVVDVIIINSGKNYTQATAIVRPFSVLVENDATANNYWSIYAWDDVRKNFFRSASQAFDTTKYWKYIDWWKAGYAPTSRITKEILDTSVEPSITVELGDLIRIKEYGAGGWAVFEKITEGSDLPLGNYNLVGRQNGTIQLLRILYDANISGVGFDNLVSFDTGLYDLEPTRELRNILRAVKENIFLGDYRIEWNRLFFNSIRYVLHEQTYVDWLFKSSFLKATHNVGNLKIIPNYKNDNLSSYQDYIEEVKPYRTTIREYVSRYNQLEGNGVAASDFDLPSVYTEEAGRITTIDENSPLVTQQPWKTWFDNRGYSIKEIVIARGGSGYTSPPRVLIEGNGTGASAQAFVSSGRVTAVRIINKGKGYTQTPIISLVGGNGSSTDNAKAVAYLGEGNSRSFELKIKFDRTNREGLFNSFTDSETFTATGTTSVFDLRYAPSTDKTKIGVTKNSQIVLGSEYRISLFTKAINGYSLIQGRIIFNTAPQLGDVVKIDYSKNDELLDSVDRINKYYNPSEGMKGKELHQLMTGIDYGGVQIQGTTFDVTGGWDALPWFTDSWDSVETNADYYVVTDGSTDSVTLPYTPEDGQEINVYLKRVGEAALPSIDDLQYSASVSNPPIVRIDDPFFFEGNDSSTSANPNAQMPTFIGDGSTNTVEIGQYIKTNDGDILIFRPVESDGAVRITDPNIVDTNIGGGSLSAINGAYATATGLTVEEIKITGGRFIGPEQVPSPEENIPGQVLDNLSIKVYQTTNTGAAPLESSVTISDGSTSVYEIGQNVLEDKSVLVYVDGIKQILNSDYTVNNTSIELNTVPDADKKIEIISIGIGGVGLLDYQEFIADGETGLFLTNAPYSLTTSVFASIDGVATDAVFSDSTDTVDTVGRSLVQFGVIPPARSTIKIVVFQASNKVDSGQLGLVRINRQTTVMGTDRAIDLDNFVELTDESSIASMVVEINNIKLSGVDTIYEIYDGVTNSFTLGLDPFEGAGAILGSNISLFVNGERKEFIQDFVYDGTTKILTITAGIASPGDVIKIENNLRSQYVILNNRLVIADSVSFSPGDLLNVTWFSEYPSMQIFSDRITGGKVNYELPYVPLGVSYVWVYKNGVRLTQDDDYSISLPRGVIYLNDDNTEDDVITITVFGSSVYRLPSSFEISKDVLNVYRYNRYSRNSVRLVNDLNYYDDVITITENFNNVYRPDRNRNIPGIIEIDNEKIEYLRTNVGSAGTTILRQLRRGVQGTSIKELHSAGDYVVDIGPKEALPYSETQSRTDFVADGSSVLIGPLDFNPLKSTVGAWTATSIPSDYGRCDVVEVFVGGRRLRKTPLAVYDEALGPLSPGADREIEAEFSVDGVSPYIRLTTAPAAGTRITVIKRTGNSWYDRGTTTATSGVTLLENSTAISKFIAAKSTQLPE